MKQRLFRYTLVITLVALLSSCTEKDKSNDVFFKIGSNQGEAAQVIGIVRRLNEKPISQANVFWGGLSVKTDSTGYFKLSKITLGDQVLRVSHKAFAEQLYSLRVRKKKNLVHIYLVAKSVRRGLNLKKNQVVRNSSMNIKIGANSLVDKNNNIVSKGELHFNYIDVRGKGLRSAPGRLVGVSENGENVNLETFGMFDVTAKNKQQKLQVAKGRHIEVLVKLLVPTKDKQIPLWSLDEKKGIWRQEGVGHVVIRKGKPWIRAKLYHLSYYNFDKKMSSSAIWVDSVEVERMSEAGPTTETALPDFVRGRGRDYTGVASIQNEQNGKVCLMAKRGGKLMLEVRTYLKDMVFTGKKLVTASNEDSTCSIADRSKALIISKMPLKKVAEQEVEKTGSVARGITLVQLHKKYGKLNIVTLKTHEVHIGALRDKGEHFYIYTTKGRKKVAKASVMSIKPVANTF